MAVQVEIEALDLEELKAHALRMGWKFVKERLLPLGGYWRDSRGTCYYAKLSEQSEREKKE